jgi:hypothetical protein
MNYSGQKLRNQRGDSGRILFKTANTAQQNYFSSTEPASLPEKFSVLHY